MARTLSKAELARVADIVDLYDDDEDGRIRAAELPDVLRALGYYPSQAQCHAILAKYDGDGDGGLDVREVQALVASEPIPEATTDEQLRAAFEAFDADGSGLISKEELVAAMTQRGEPLTVAEAEAMIAAVDTDADGELDFDEFKAMMAGGALPVDSASDMTLSAPQSGNLGRLGSAPPSGNLRRM